MGSISHTGRAAGPCGCRFQIGLDRCGRPGVTGRRPTASRLVAAGWPVWLRLLILPTGLTAPPPSPVSPRPVPSAHPMCLAPPPRAGSARRRRVHARPPAAMPQGRAPAHARVLRGAPGPDPDPDSDPGPGPGLGHSLRQLASDTRPVLAALALAAFTLSPQHCAPRRARQTPIVIHTELLAPCSLRFVPSLLHIGTAAPPVRHIY